MKFTPLSRLLTEGPREDDVVAWRNDHAVRFGQFRDIAAAVSASVRYRERVALICRDSVLFAAGFMGLVQAGAEIVLPASDNPALLAAMSGAFDRHLDDDAILAASGIAPLGAVASGAVPITLFTSARLWPFHAA
jgi:hypothetical protein